MRQRFGHELGIAHEVSARLGDGFSKEPTAPVWNRRVPGTGIGLYLGNHVQRRYARHVGSRRSSTRERRELDEGDLRCRLFEQLFSHKIKVADFTLFSAAQWLSPVTEKETPQCRRLFRRMHLSWSQRQKTILFCS